MSKASLETELRIDFLKSITEMIQTKYEADVLPISASEIAIPVVDAEHNDKFVLIKVSIPRGTRNGEGSYDEYDGYGLAEAYADECANRQAKKEASEAKKKAEAEAKARKREAKKTIKELNKKGLNAMIHEGE